MGIGFWIGFETESGAGGLLFPWAKAHGPLSPVHDQGVSSCRYLPSMYCLRAAYVAERGCAPARTAFQDPAIPNVLLPTVRTVLVSNQPFSLSTVLTPSMSVEYLRHPTALPCSLKSRLGPLIWSEINVLL